jgi:hypothetical protein
MFIMYSKKEREKKTHIKHYSLESVLHTKQLFKTH